MAHLSGRSGSVGRLTRVQVVTVYVSDVDRAIGFYRDRLGLDLVAEWQGENGDRMAFVKPAEGRTEIGLYAPGTDDPRVGTGTGLVLTTEDVRACHERLVETGVVVTRPLVMHDYGEGDRAGDTGDLEFEIADPDGNRVVVHS